MKFSEKNEILNKIAMITFVVVIFLFVGGSSFVYFNNSSNVEIKIKTDNIVNRENTAVNEALTRTLVMKNDTIDSYKELIHQKDSIYVNNIGVMEKVIKKSKREKDSLINILRNFKQSDIQPIDRKQTK